MINDLRGALEAGGAASKPFEISLTLRGFQTRVHLSKFATIFVTVSKTWKVDALMIEIYAACR